MGFPRAIMEPGTAQEADVYIPFKLQQVDGTWFKVLKGEAFYNPTIGGEILDIQGLELPFQVNHRSFIYLQVFVDLSGRPIHSEICHTGNHLAWLAAGEKWLGWPKMFSVSDPIESVPYYGMANHAYHFDHHGQRPFWHGSSNRPAHAKKLWAQVDGGHWGGRQGTDCHGGGGVNGNPDPESSLSIYLNAPAKNNYYRGIDRELRKGICAQKNVGTYASRAMGQAPPFNTRRQRKGYKSPAGGYPNRGYYEMGGSRYPVTHAGAGCNFQQDEFYHLWKSVNQTWLTSTVKLHKTEYDQVACYYPIAYATGASKPYRDGTVGGTKIAADDGNPAKGEPATPAYQMIQACKSHLQMSTVLEGDLQIKALLPYQGFDTDVHKKYESRGTSNILDFGQVYPYYDRVAEAHTAHFPYPLGYVRAMFNGENGYPPANAKNL